MAQQCPDEITILFTPGDALGDGQVVNLCWKIGEDSIDYWHGLDEGYAKRRPL